MEKIIFFGLVIPIFLFVLYLGGRAIMTGFSAKSSNKSDAEIETNENRLKRIQAYYNSDGCSHWAFLCELKIYPYGFKTRYENKGFIKFKSKINENGKIPQDRFNMI